MSNTKLRMVVSTNVGQLLEKAAEGFLKQVEATPTNPFPTPGYLLVLRQGGLRDDLIRLAARKEHKGWFDPPLCIFHELPEWFGAPQTPVIGDVARVAMLGNVVRSVAGEVFGQLHRLDYYLGALDQFLGELISEGVTPAEFEAAADTLAGFSGVWAERKNSELASIYRSYCDALESAGLRDGRASLVAVAHEMTKDSKGLEGRLGGRREIRVFGLADLRGGWRKLLTAVVESPVIDRVHIYSTREFLDDELAGLPPTSVVHLPDSTNMGAMLFGPSGQTERQEARARFSVIEAPSTNRELSEVAVRVRALIDAGVPSNRVAVIARSGRPYVDLAVRALHVMGVPAYARLRIAFYEIPVVKAIFCLLAAAAEGWTRQRLTELAGQPHFKSLLDARVVNFVGYRRAVRGLQSWGTAIERLRQELSNTSREESEDGAKAAGRPSPDRVTKAARYFTSFADLASELDDKRELLGWIGWLRGFVTNDPWEVEKHIYSIPFQGYHAVKIDLAGWQGLRTILTEWENAVAKWGDVGKPSQEDSKTMTVGDFSRRLREMLDGQVGIWSTNQRGVPVMEALAAAYRNFDHVFLVGMDAGSFPRNPTRSPILDDDERRQLGKAGIYLDTRRDWDLRERDLFRTIVSGANQLTVSYPTVDVRGKENIRSAFVEALSDVADEIPSDVDEFAVITPGTPLVATNAAAKVAEHGASIERERRAGTASAWSGLIENGDLREWLGELFNDDRLWSPSQIESYAKCPWAYFSGRLLRMEKLQDPDEDMEATVRGSLLHDSLARFYNRVGIERESPVFLRTADLEWAEPLMEQSLDAAFDEMEEHTWMGHPILRATKRSELKRDLLRYLAWEAELHDKMDGKRGKAPTILRTGAESHELAFGTEGEVVLERRSVRFKFRGFIDRVDRGVDPRVDDPSRFVAAIDYKSSLSSVPGRGRGAAWDDGVVLQVPLYAYALTKIYDAVEVSRVEYRALGETKPGASPGSAYPHCLQLRLVDRKSGELDHDSSAVDRMENALEAVVDHVKSMRDGKFSVKPAPSCRCPSYCHAYDVCRVTPDARAGKRK